MSYSSSQISSLHAILVGINEYKEQPSLLHAAGDARTIRDFLKNEWNASVKLLTDANATKEAIIGSLSSLCEEPDFTRNDPIVFFFSGYAGKAGASGIICPTDFRDKGGISDQMLIKLFDQLSKAGGNNITVFLDCPSKTFTWGNPRSFTVVAPEVAEETENGGAFAIALLKVLKAESKNLDLLTVQSLAHKIDADMGVRVNCSGRNIDRLLFNPTAGKAYHAFIYGHTEEDGSIMLTAGSAQGVQPDATYAIYSSNVISTKNKVLGYLLVSSVEGECSAKLRFPERGAFKLCNVFYAALTHCPGESVDIFISDTSTQTATTESSPSSTMLYRPSSPMVALVTTASSRSSNNLDTLLASSFESPPSMTEVDARRSSIIESSPGSNEIAIPDIANTQRDCEDANIILTFEPDYVSFLWNGLQKDDEHMRKTDVTTRIQLKRLEKMLRMAARFKYHLSRSAPRDSMISGGLKVELWDVDNKPEGGTIKMTKGAPISMMNGRFVMMEAELYETRQVCLTLENHSKFPVWPFIFIFDPPNLGIDPWYSPTVPLQKGDPPLLVGCGDEGSLYFRSSKRKVGIVYLMIFATTERATFSSLKQRFDPASDGDPMTIGYKDASKILEHSASQMTRDNLSGQSQLSGGEGILHPHQSAQWSTTRITILYKWGRAISSD